MIFIVIGVTTAALLFGALWGVYGKLSDNVEGFIVAMAGGALIVSVMAELLEPASEHVALWALLSMFGAGAVVFTAVDVWIDSRIGQDSGGGLLAAVVVDGVPENLALGVALISAGPAGVLALAGSIFLSNLPEAAGGARNMRNNGFSAAKVFGVWLTAALILGAAAIAGYQLFSPADKPVIALIQGFAAGAVVASLATEVFPKAYRKDNDAVGIAVAIGVACAFGLHQLG